MAPSLVYLLCTLTSLLCAVLLFRSYAASKAPLLLWAALCFFGLAANTALLVVDMFVPEDLTLWRKLPALAGALVLLHGLIGSSR